MPLNYEREARKYFIGKYNLDKSISYVDLLKYLIDKSDNKILFDGQFNKENSAQIISSLIYKRWI